jgi:hypothetical protein
MRLPTTGFLWFLDFGRGDARRFPATPTLSAQVFPILE